MRRSPALRKWLAPGAVGLFLFSGDPLAAQDPRFPGFYPPVPPDPSAIAITQPPANPGTGTGAGAAGQGNGQATPGMPPTPGMQPTPGMPPTPGTGQGSSTTPTPSQNTQAPTDTGATSTGGAGASAAAQGLFGSAGGTTSTGATSASQASSLGTPGASNVAGGQDAIARATTDVGNLLDRSPSATGVEVQRRNAIVNDPRVRGYHVGQLFTQADGAYWLPARQDLDTVVSKFDSSMVRNVVVVKGPYSARYGPGFAFLDIETQDAPRYESGFESHFSTSTTYKTNGKQILNREENWGGDSNWGYRLGYSINVGSDYETGGGDGDRFHIPSSFNSQFVNGAFGFNLSQDSRLEIKVLYVLQQNVELPGVVTDINRLQTDSVNVRYVLENQDWFDRYTVDGWYNYTRFSGGSLNPSKALQIPILSPVNAIVFTDSGLMSTGFRQYLTWGTERGPQLTAGIDCRYVSQRLNEFDDGVIVNGLPPDGLYSNFSVPRSHSINPGLFMDVNLPVTEALTVKAGGRLDMVVTDVDDVPPGRTENTLVNVLNTTRFDHDFELWSAFATAEYKFTPNWTGTIGVGAAQRPPTLTELYATQPFIAALQQGLTFVNGDPNLRPERLWQTDVGLRVSYPWLQAGVNGFYAWVNDYITYDRIGAPAGLVGAQFVNTDLAVLMGFEAYGELELTDWLTPFFTMSYVRGRDETRNDRRTNLLGLTSWQEALPGIPPLDTRLGVRFHDTQRNPRWAIEFLARLVDNQDQVAQSLGEVETPHFTTFDLRGYWRASDNLTLTAGVENLGNKLYQEHLDLRTGFGVFQPGRNFYFGVEYKR